MKNSLSPSRSLFNVTIIQIVTGVKVITGKLFLRIWKISPPPGGQRPSENISQFRGKYFQSLVITPVTVYLVIPQTIIQIVTDGEVNI